MNGYDQMRNANTLGDSALGQRTMVQSSQDGHIAMAFAEMDRQLLTLADELGTLEAKFGPAMRPGAPASPGSSTGSSAPQPVVSQIANGLESFNQRIQVLTFRVRDMLARADL